MRIYLAGKISKGDWRHKVMSASVDHISKSFEEWNRPWSSRRAKCLNHDYVGPFFTSDDHGCSHSVGRGVHGNADASCFISDENAVQQFILRECLSAISTADLVFAWLDELDAYGTYAELGYARAKSVLTVIGVGEWLRRRSDGWKQLWFVARMADHMVWESSPEDACKSAVAWAEPRYLGNQMAKLLRTDSVQ